MCVWLGGGEYNYDREEFGGMSYGALCVCVGKWVGGG